MVKASNKLTQIAAAAALLSSALLPFSPGAEAAGYPDKPVTIIVPFAPGGAVDASARILAEKLGEVMGQNFIVENRPGASGNIGYAAAARSDADGYTLLMGYSTSSTCSPAIFPNLNWKPEDFRAVASYAQFPMVITVHPDVPATTLPELITYLKEHPGELNYGAVGVGSQVHIASETFKKMTGTDLAAVQYKGSGEVIADLLSGSVQMVIDAYGPYRQHVASGALRAIAVAAAERDPNLSDIPTAAEQGLEGFEQLGFMPLLVPAGTDSAIVEALATAVEKASQDPAFQAKTTSVNLTNQYRGPEELTALLARMTTECAEVVQSSGITLE